MGKKPFNLSLTQIKEVRRGILLAKHDHQLNIFETKHKELGEDIVEDMLEVYSSTEKLIIGNAVITDLTVEAYKRTIEKLRERRPLPD